LLNMTYPPKKSSNKRSVVGGDGIEPPTSCV
jgi:hypothetical protein